MLAEAGRIPKFSLPISTSASAAEARAKIPSLKHGREFEVEIAGARPSPKRGQMIRYALACEEGHGFDAWFGSAACL